MFKDIFTNIQNNNPLTREEALALLTIPVGSGDYYKLLDLSNQLSRITYDNKGKLFAQLGLDHQPCSVNCKFCSLACSNCTDTQVVIHPVDKIAKDIEKLMTLSVDELFLMTTADFSQDEFLEYGKLARKIIPENMPLVANVGDFDEAYGKELAKVGFTGVYHICRLGEGVDTDATIEMRIATMEAIKASGMELYYCVEPIGPEHSDEQLVTEMLRILDYPVSVMAVMKRVAVENTLTYSRGEITNARLAQICAVTNLVVRPTRAMGVHEPNELCLMAGANQIYCELGSNPRDNQIYTERGRDFSPTKGKEMLKNTCWNEY